MIHGSKLRGLYLDPLMAGVPWLLDPDNPDVPAALRAATRRTAADTCEVPALLRGGRVAWLLRLAAGARLAGGLSPAPRRR